MLPGEIIDLEYLPVSELLRNVSKVCIQLWMILRKNTLLYTDVHFKDCFEIDEHILNLVTQNSQHLRVLEL